MICKLFRHNMLVSSVWYSLPRRACTIQIIAEKITPAGLVLGIHLDSKTFALHA